MAPVQRVILLLVLLASFAGVSLQEEVVISVTAPAFIPMNHSKLGAPYKLRIGIISVASSLGPATEGMLVAAQYLNNNASILPDVAIELYQSPYSTVDTDNLFNALYHLKVLNVHGLISALTSAESKVVQQIAKLYTVPQISPNAITSALSDKSQYPTFMRTIGSDLSQIQAIIAFFQECGWTKGLVIYSPDEYGNGYSALIAAATNNNISLAAFAAPITGNSAAAYMGVMQTVKIQADKNGYRIFILYVTTPGMAGYAMLAMNATGLLGPEYVQILTASTPDAFVDPAQFMYNSPVLEGVFGIGSGFPTGSEFETVLSYWQTQNLTQWKGVYGAPFYCIDAVFAYAYAVDSLMKAGVPFENATGMVLLNQMLNQTFMGTTGEVQMDHQGNRIGSFDLYSFHYNQNTTRVGTYSVRDKTYTKLAPYIFYNGSTTIPRDSPYACPYCMHGQCIIDVGCQCFAGYTGATCDVKKSSMTNILPWLIPVIAVAVLGTFIGGFIFYKKKRSALVRSVAEKQRSQIPRSDLVLHDRIGRGASGEVCKAMFRGTDVAVKKIIVSHVSKQAIEEFELEVAIMCGLRHPNIILFMGSCFDADNREMLLVMEFMSRGSLNDVLNNPKIQLTNEMKLSLACQAAQGMNFLHMSSPPLIHRDLKSHNILIDDKWNARISDFGITKFKEDTRAAKNSDANREKSIGTIYWTAPEALQGEPNITEKCDCYSFGIVLWEIMHRQNPYLGRDPMSVAIEVIRSNLRPTISQDVPAELKELIQACWATKPEDRPSFQSIMNTLRKLLSISSVSPQNNYSGARVEAPTGHVYLVATGVEGAYALWEAIPRGMEEAMKLHNQIIRKNLDLYIGYEASFADHSFVAAFNTLEDAVNFTVVTQTSLLHAKWPEELLAHPSGRAVYESNELAWAGLKVKMGICAGVPNCEIDNSSGRMKYFGSVVDKTVQLLGLHKGYILVGEQVATEINKRNPKFVHEISMNKVGDIASISARNKTNDIYAVSIKSLHRMSSVTRMPSEPELPHTVVSFLDYEDDGVSLTRIPTPPPNDQLTGGNISDVQSVTWVTTKGEIGVKDTIGKGPIGDYFRGHWRGREVAVKVLVNQKLKEDDIFKLVGDSAYMSKLNHPNILPFYAVCLEPNYIAVVSEYESRGNLKTILADSSIQLPWSRKIKIALELAHGLSYLSSLPDTTLQMHDNLKSNNVLIGKDWEVKIADYGHGNIRELARTMTSVGNVAWTAPEILNGLPATPTISIYAYGIILWELYTRQIPYTNEHPIRVVTKILNGYRPPVPADCPSAYKQIIEECLDGEPQNRPSWGKIISTLSPLA